MGVDQKKVSKNKIVKNSGIKNKSRDKGGISMGHEDNKNGFQKGQLNKVTHQEFITFLDPYLDLVTEKGYLETLKETNFGNLKYINSSDYLQHINSLKNRIYASMILDKPFKPEKTYETPLLPCNFENRSNSPNTDDIKNDAALYKQNAVDMSTPGMTAVDGTSISFFAENKILQFFKTQKNIPLEEEYKNIILQNNRYKQEIKNILPNRVFYKAYFKLYDSIHKELVAFYLKRRTKKKRKFEEFDFDILLELLKREKEFLEEFGHFENIQVDFDYPDVLK